MKKKQRVNPFAIGGGFVDYCIREQILEVSVDEHEVKYYLTQDGEEILKTQFGMILSNCAKIKE